ncbi:MAG: hypothetical protein ACJ76N_04530 [Thermoanaerobaculia bacterium]
MSESGERARVQARIDAALAGARWSPYLATYGMDLQERLERAAAGGGLAGIESALDEFEALSQGGDAGRARSALMSFLAEHPEVPRLGLKVPRRPEPPR